MEGLTVIPDIANAYYSGEEIPEIVVHPDTEEEIGRVGYVHTDAWRGYNEVTPLEGWLKVGEGCNCGDWGDTPPGTSNDECEAQINELIAEYSEVVLILCGGSNVFAMQYDVLARKE